jgi:hypothetical protein
MVESKLAQAVVRGVSDRPWIHGGIGLAYPASGQTSPCSLLLHLQRLAYHSGAAMLVQKADGSTGPPDPME